MVVDILIIGAQAAGMNAASRVKEVNSDLRVTVLEKGPYVSVGASGLPYYIGGMVFEGESLQEARHFQEALGISILREHEVESIDPPGRQVTAVSLADRQKKVFRYNKLIIATGSQVRRPGVVGEDLPEVFVLKTLEDGMAIRNFIDTKNPRRVAIIGAGVIGLEMAEAFRRQGLEVTILKRPGSILRMLDDVLTKRVETELQRQGVQVCLDLDIQKINGRDGHVVSVTCSGQEYPADFVLLATGTVPQTELAKNAGLRIGPFGDIVVDDQMMTSDPNILAAGDCVGQVHRVTGKSVYLTRGSTASKQGSIAGANAAGYNERFAGVLGTAVCKIFDLEVASTGFNERAAAAAGFDYLTVQITQMSHESSFPDPPPAPMDVRLVVEKGSGRLLGGQMVGEIGVAKRIDVLAAAISAGMTAAQVGDLDLSYAPPFAPVWDPIILAAQAADRAVRSTDRQHAAKI